MKKTKGQLAKYQRDYYKRTEKMTEAELIASSSRSPQEYARRFEFFLKEKKRIQRELGILNYKKG